VLAGASRDGATSVVWVRDLAAGHQRRIAEHAVWPLLSADGHKLVYQGPTSQRTDVGRGPLFLAATDGSSARQVCGICGEPYQFFARDSKVLFDHADAKSHEIKSIDLSTGQLHLLLQHPKSPLFVPHLSPDEKWISFSMVVRRWRRWTTPVFPTGIHTDNVPDPKLQYFRFGPT
jgi:hypothetical protein